SALLGYFLGLAWFYRQHRRKLIIIGLAAATFAHFVFNITLLTANNQSQGFLYSSQAVIILLILISVLFARLRRRMVC
ncbi:MAG: PrsW family glutamic-type intramembrane protease, partial [Patescibacteria group bacterium]